MNATLEQSIFVAIGIGFVKSIVCAYDVLTHPFYWMVQKPWQFKKKSKKIRARHAVPNDPSSGT